MHNHVLYLQSTIYFVCFMLLMHNKYMYAENVESLISTQAIIIKTKAYYVRQIGYVRGSVDGLLLFAAHQSRHSTHVSRKQSSSYTYTQQQPRAQPHGCRPTIHHHPQVLTFILSCTHIGFIRSTTAHAKTCLNH